ncbi:MAG TPA: GHMP kinase [Candidatus Brocadiia bacterium]|nr:GHMP kinase [Candidatus Brocadiia bacterium]
MPIIKKRAYARAGLIGNPSDGYFGKTISLIVKNMSATVTLWESPELVLENSERDRTHFKNVEDLCDEVSRFGYYSGARLMRATVKRFAGHCASRGVKLPARNFTCRYNSNIPRHVGLAGSSAIITAFLRALCEFYQVEIPKVEQPNLILAVENKELGISAGLQDRVIQVYEGVVYMDFDREYMAATGHGRYEPLDPGLLPPLFIAYRTDLSEGSEVFHNNIRQRFNAGDPQVVEAMKQFASFAAQARQALLERRPFDIGPLMNANFDLRATIYDISPKNREMVRIGRENGAWTKFSGSGGAVIGAYRDEAAYPRIEAAYTEAGFKIFKPRIV